MSATAVAKRAVVSSMEQPSERIKAQMRQFRLEGARLAAMILYAEPERIGDQAIGDFLLQVPYLKREVAEEWLRRAGVNPWRSADKLKSWERRTLAEILVQYSKGTGA